MTTKYTTEQLAKLFSVALREQIGDDIFLVIKKNQEKEYQTYRSCASHDYCDANVIMHETLTTALGVDTDLQSLWNLVWNCAKKNDFFVNSL